MKECLLFVGCDWLVKFSQKKLNENQKKNETKRNEIRAKIYKSF